MSARPHDPLSMLDPRARVGGVVMLCVATVWAGAWSALLLAALLPVLVGVLFRFPFATLGRMVIRLNALFLLLALMTLPFMQGEVWLSFGSISVTRPGAEWMGLIILRGNALVLQVAIFCSTLSPADLGHALGRLKVPPLFVQLLMSVIRYIDVLLVEYGRLRMAMRARGFRPRLNRLTLQAHGQWVGTLFLRSLERAERVADAMKCRGHHGVYLATRAWRWGGRDTACLLSIAACILIMVGMEWRS